MITFDHEPLPSNMHAAPTNSNRTLPRDTLPFSADISLDQPGVTGIYTIMGELLQAENCTKGHLYFGTGELQDNIKRCSNESQEWESNEEVQRLPVF